MQDNDFSELQKRLSAIRGTLSERNVMGYSGSVAPDVKTKAVLDLVDVVDDVVKHLRGEG